MNDLRNLHDAFDALEERADAASNHEHVTVPHRRRRSLAPVAAAAAALLAAATVAIWQHSDNGAPSTAPAGAGHAVPMVVSAAPTSPTSSAPGTDRAYQPPTTIAQLTAKAREILAGVATIDVTDGSGQGSGAPSQSAPMNVERRGGRMVSTAATPFAPVAAAESDDAGSGAAIVGTLTADGVTGGFDLDVYASPGGAPMCDSDTHCSVQHRSDGSSLAIGSWHDQQVPGGVTYQVEIVRADGADVLMHLSTEHDPKGESRVTAAHLPLTVKQMVDFVSSDRW